MHSGLGKDSPADRRPERPRGDSEELADILADPHCRHVLDYLRRADGPVEVSALARRVVAAITDTPPEEVADDLRRRVETWLHHGQLPMLAAYDIVEYDPETGLVRLVPGAHG